MARSAPAGAPPEFERLSRLIARARVLPVDIDTIEAVAQLRNECRQIGHGLHQRGHNADLWIAATAIRWGIPLVARDATRFGDCVPYDPSHTVSLMSFPFRQSRDSGWHASCGFLSMYARSTSASKTLSHTLTVTSATSWHGQPSLR
jgi:hypothetical protein